MAGGAYGSMGRDVEGAAVSEGRRSGRRSVQVALAVLLVGVALVAAVWGAGSGFSGLARLRNQGRSVALEEEVPEDAAEGFAGSVVSGGKASLVETEFGVDKDSDLTHYQRTQLKAMTCGVGACTSGEGCDTSTFDKCMDMHPQKREEFVQAKLPHLKMTDGLIQDLPDDVEAEEKSEGGVKGVLGKIPKEDIAANCGAGACEFQKGCDERAFTSCMAEKPGYVPKEGRVSPEAQNEMMGIRAKGKGGSKGGKNKPGPKTNLAASAVAELRAKVAAVRSL